MYICNVYMYICMYVCIYVYMYICIYLYEPVNHLNNSLLNLATQECSTNSASCVSRFQPSMKFCV